MELWARHLPQDLLRMATTHLTVVPSVNSLMQSRLPLSVATVTVAAAADVVGAKLVESMVARWVVASLGHILHRFTVMREGATQMRQAKLNKLHSVAREDPNRTAAITRARSPMLEDSPMPT